MAEVDPPVDVDQRLIQGVVDRRPSCGFQLGDGQQLVLRQASATGPDGFHSCADDFLPSVLLDTLQHFLKEIVDGLAIEVVSDFRVQLLMNTEDAEFFQQCFEEERITRKRVGLDAGELGAGQGRAISGKEILDEGGLVRLAQRAHAKLGPCHALVGGGYGAGPQPSWPSG